MTCTSRDSIQFVTLCVRHHLCVTWLTQFVTLSLTCKVRDSLFVCGIVTHTVRDSLCETSCMCDLYKSCLSLTYIVRDSLFLRDTVTDAVCDSLCETSFVCVIVTYTVRDNVCAWHRDSCSSWLSLWLIQFVTHHLCVTLWLIQSVTLSVHDIPSEGCIVHMAMLV